MTKIYSQPVVIDHGKMVSATNGTCTCHDEATGFKPATEE